MPLSKTKIREILAREMPNYQVVSKAALADGHFSAQAEATSPSLSELRRKYLGVDAPAATRAGSDNPGHGKRKSRKLAETIVVVEPDTAEAREHGPGKKVVFLSDDGSITGVQG